MTAAVPSSMMVHVKTSTTTIAITRVASNTHFC
ncbi:hypothetical protein PPTG_21447 [Phytophthora nicotianae INRA-310]|uniref:Uncharacterized protein n=2 Tax=Phytophthora nicotianae TaxID=4792 RepID=W2R494_PHYN3|nr:hypothetical protein PPTG_21447 [Phytophthora nicotianae INRA-310]ETI38735.1 hypothetical protein F443_15625 [Phytophthora nicotianae P1569]ETN19305.1 hypothetical protein PPTG_21447 [Phytophthora nicotianae INRA-310]